MRLGARSDDLANPSSQVVRLNRRIRPLAEKPDVLTDTCPPSFPAPHLPDMPRRQSWRAGSRMAAVRTERRRRWRQKGHGSI